MFGLSRIEELCIVALVALIIGMGVMWPSERYSIQVSMQPTQVPTPPVAPPVAPTVAPGGVPPVAVRVAPVNVPAMDEKTRRVNGIGDDRCNNLPGVVWIDESKTCVPWPPSPR